MRGRAIFCIHSWRFSKSYSKNLSIRGIVVPRVMRPAGVALPNFLKARQVLAGWGDALKSRDVLKVAASATASVLVLWPQATFAQSSSGSASQSLPSVVVTSPEKRTAATTTRRSARPAAQSATASRRPQPKREATTIVENPRGAVQGYVAGRSMAGTKTNTPIMQTPQSLSVIGSEQIRDQKPGKFDEILRYTPGVVAGTFGADTRNDWFLIRGFKSDDVGLFLDGLQLFYTSYASWKLQPFNLARVEVLRGPSAVLYGGSSPSGIVNAVSKMPPAEPIRYIETGVNNFGNAYLWVRFRRPGRDRARKRQAVLPCGRPDPERRHPGRFHARQQLLHRAVAAPGSRMPIRRSPCWRQLRRPTPAASTSCPISARWSTRRSAGSRPACSPAIPASISSRASRRCSAISSSAISPTTSHSGRTPDSPMSTSPIDGYIGNGYINIGHGHSSAATIGTRRTPPTRAISTTSWNTVSTPASGAAHDAVRPRSQELPDRRLAGFDFGGVPSLNVLNPVYGLQHPASAALRHSATSDSRRSRLGTLCPGPDQVRPLHAGAERPQ